MTRALAWIGAIAITMVMLYVLAHVTVTTDSSVPTTAVVTPAPTPTPAPDPFAPARWAAANVAVIALMLAIGVGLPVSIALHHWHRSKLPTEDWRIPFRDPLFPYALDAHVRTSFPPVPQTYSPSLHIRNDPTAEVGAPPTTLPAPGSIDDLLSHGRGLAYGWRTDNGEVFADARIRSLLVGGVQGSGKTTFVTLVAAQLARMAARIMLADPDALNEEGLASRLAGLGVQPEATAHEPLEVLRMVLDAQHELMTRKGQGTHADGRPYVLIVDELPEVLRMLKDRDTDRVRSALELIGGFSGRKHLVVTIMLAQSWMRSVVGSTAIRNLIPASAVFRMRSDEARAMTGLRADYWSADPIDLEPGTFYAVGIDSGAVRVRVPALPPARAGAHARAASNRPFGSGSPVVMGALSEPMPNGFRTGQKPLSEPTVLPPELPEHRVRELLEQGYDIGRVIRELAGVKRGDQYRQLHLGVQRWLVGRIHRDA